MKNKTYVLIPLPSIVRDKCLVSEHSYLEEKGCVNGILSQKNYNEIHELGSSLLKRLKKKPEERNVHPVLISFADKEILSSLKRNDVLYITAHGNTESMGNNDVGVNISPEKLCDLLKDAGLSKNLQTVKIMACNSALNKDNLSAYGSATKNAPKKIFKHSFIERFLMQSQEVFPHLDVAGYLGYLADVHNSKQLKDMNSVVRFFNTGNALRAKEARIFAISPKSLRAEDDIEEIEEQNETKIALFNFTNS